MRPHTCHAIACTKIVPPKMLMCSRHWFMVPKPLRDKVWATYRPGQELGKVLPSTQWHVAADAAIKAVATREGKMVQA